MKRLALFFAFHLLLVALLPGGDLQSLVRMGQSVAHHLHDHQYSEHGKSMLSFLLEHLENPEHDHEHEHGPTEHVSSSAISVFVPAETPVFILQPGFIASLQKAASFYRSSVPTRAEATIWQPPRA